MSARRRVHYVSAKMAFPCSDRDIEACVMGGRLMPCLTADLTEVTCNECWEAIKGMAETAPRTGGPQGLRDRYAAHHFTPEDHHGPRFARAFEALLKEFEG